MSIVGPLFILIYTKSNMIVLVLAFHSREKNKMTLRSFESFFTFQ